MIHLHNVQKYSGTLKELVEDIGDLRYDALADFLLDLSLKLSKDGCADLKRDRSKLSEELNNASRSIRNAWIISEPFMLENNTDNVQKT